MSEKQIVISDEMKQWLDNTLKDPSITSFAYKDINQDHKFLTNKPETEFTFKTIQKVGEEYIVLKPPFHFEYFINQASVYSHLTKLSLDVSHFLIGDYENVLVENEYESEEIPVAKPSQYAIDVLFPCLGKFVEESKTLDYLSLSWDRRHHDIVNLLPNYEDSFNKFIESMKKNQSITKWKLFNFHCFDSVDDLYQWKPSSVLLLQEPMRSHTDKSTRDTLPLRGLYNMEKVNKLDICLYLLNPNSPAKVKNFFNESQYITSITIHRKYDIRDQLEKSTEDIFNLIHTLPNLKRIKFDFVQHKVQWWTDQVIRIIKDNKIKKLSLLYCKFDFKKIAEAIMNNTSITHFVFSQMYYLGEFSFKKLLQSSKIEKLGLSPYIHQSPSTSNVSKEDFEFIEANPSTVYIRPFKCWDYSYGPI